jgi:ribose transport system ATP-binding protein
VGPQAVTASLAATHISKSFAGTRALDDAHLTVLQGEVHALLGENGSGKSTLIKVLAGYHAPDPGGRLAVNGRQLQLPLSPGQARELGLRFVYQDLALIPSLSVVENLWLEELATARRLRISWRAERARAAQALLHAGVHIDPRARVDGLGPAERASLALARAIEGLPRSGGVLVLDEPTAFLPHSAREHLFGLIRELAGAGRSVVLVSHELGEVRQVADRVTVLRDGRNTGTVEVPAVDAQQLVEMVIGHPLGSLAAAHGPGTAAEGTIAVSALTGEVVDGLCIRLSPAQVVGLTGLPGSGFDEVPYLLFGARRARSGRLTLGDEIDLTTITPARALRAGMALLPAERERDGGVGSLSVGANVTLPVLDRHASRLRLDRRRLHEVAARLLARHDVRPNAPGLALGALSGGNQQKALLAKWLQTEPPLLLLDEPTRGVDVGARQEILATIRGLVGQGMSVLCASSDHDQLAALCDRVLIFSGGKVVGELAGEAVTKERIAELCHRAR